MDGRREAASPDMVIFDVDGVLLDTSQSFPRVIEAVLLWAWTRVLDRAADCEGFSPLHFEACKTHPSFNDDYDIAWAIINCAAASGSPSLRESLPSPGEWKNIIEEHCRDDISSFVRDTFGETVRRDEVRRACEELYYGCDYLDSLGRPALHITRRGGMWEREFPLFRAHWSAIPLPVGLYTGRTREELDLALKLLHWEDFPPSMAVTSDSGILKPSPEGLALLCTRGGASFPLFLGDTESDRRTMHLFGRGLFHAIGSMIPGEKAFPSPHHVLRELKLLP